MVHRNAQNSSSLYILSTTSKIAFPTASRDDRSSSFSRFAWFEMNPSSNKQAGPRKSSTAKRECCWLVPRKMTVVEC